MVKQILRWFLLGGILFFLAKTLKDHWQEVRSLEITNATWAMLTIALGVTLLAHIWGGWVWHLILKTIGQPRNGRWSTMVYLKTNIAKYLPGNVWHFYGRVRALQSSGSSTGAAIVGVLLEPLLMAAAALGLGAICFSITAIGDRRLLVLSVGALLAMLVAIHPRFLNPVLQKLGKAKAKAQGLKVITSTLRLQTYPWRSLIGELGFVILRGMGFMLTIVALHPLTPDQIFPVLGAFSMAWLLGLVVPGAPGGIGVFEAVAIALLGNQLSSGLLISSVALYRLISTLAEALGAGLIWLEERIAQFVLPVEKAKKRLLLLPPAQEDILHDDEPPSSSLKASIQNNGIQDKHEVLENGTPSQESSATIPTPPEEKSFKISDSASNSHPEYSLETTSQSDITEVPEPVLPNITPQSVTQEGEPISKSFAPRNQK